jgi:hypothetical protein
LAVLENEWHLARTDFKYGAGAMTTGRGVAEARIKEAGITVLSRCSLSVWVGALPNIGLKPVETADLTRHSGFIISPRGRHEWPWTPRRVAETTWRFRYVVQLCVHLMERPFPNEVQIGSAA